MRSIKTKDPLIELENILLDMELFDSVEVDSLVPIDQWNGAISCYLIIDGDVQKPNGLITDGVEEYDRELLVNIFINLDVSNKDKYYHLDIRDMVEEKILKDAPLWEVVLDREIFGSVWDTTKEGKKQGKIICSLSFRSCGI